MQDSGIARNHALLATYTIVAESGRIRAGAVFLVRC